MAGNEFYGALLNLGQDSLLLPNLAVAEVISAHADAAPSGAPRWWVGMVDWNGQRVPLIRFEWLNTAADTDPAQVERRKPRIAVLNSTGQHLESAQLAIECDSYPHLVALNRSAMIAEPLRDTDQDNQVLARVRLANTLACVPDLAAIEREISRFESTQATPA